MTLSIMNETRTIRVRQSFNHRKVNFAGSQFGIGNCLEDSTVTSTAKVNINLVSKELVITAS
jgi:hypothetical protein